ncbi:hypothetical protein QE152_g6348 [Popillia japonica]|uniref:Uncharacterized protein n=1 Tax=Popillia japonica TaxID=7064 RepID=A0AAW1MEK0_POPJA
MPLLKQGGSHERFSSLIHLLEPLGKVRPNIPSFPTVYSAKSAANVTLLCPAQAYPKPSYRYFPSYLVCPAQAYPKPSYRYFPSYLVCSGKEPVGLRGPRLLADVKSTTIEKPTRNGLSLLCQAQAFPMPIFRAPNLQADSKFKHVERRSNSDLSLFCQAQAYPSPTFRTHRAESAQFASRFEIEVGRTDGRK